MTEFLISDVNERNFIVLKEIFSNSSYSPTIKKEKKQKVGFLEKTISEKQSTKEIDINIDKRSVIIKKKL